MNIIQRTPYRITTLVDVEASLTTEPLMFDTETNGLYGPITLAQFYQESWPEVLIVETPDVNRLIVLLHITTVVIQNASYDISTIQAQSGKRFIPKRFCDVLLLGRLKYYKETSFTLDNLMLCTLGYDPYLGQDLAKKAMQKTNWGKTDLTDDHYVYAATDVYYLPHIYHQVKAHLEDPNYVLDIQTLRYCLDMQNEGFPVDANRRMALEMRNTMTVDEIAVPINVNSWQQVRPYINEDESDALALARYTYQGNEKAATVNRVRKLLKQNSFLKKFKTSDGRIYGKFAPSARSGRLTCKDQNLQQIPRATKGVFGYHKDTPRVLIYSDFSQLELRSAAAVIAEVRMAQLFYEGVDMHTYTQEKMNIQHEKARQIAKTCNFNLLYGGSAGMLGSILLKDAGILLSDRELYKLKNKWLQLWPTIAQWQQSGINAWNNGEVWATSLNRRYVGKMMTDQLNIAIQGSGADVAKLAYVNIMEGIQKINLEHGSDAKMVNFIHDSFFVDAPDNPTVYKDIATLVGVSMKNSWTTMSQHFKIKDIPMPVQVLVGKNWGVIEDEKQPNIYDINF